jgi:hypothetical protein
MVNKKTVFLLKQKSYVTKIIICPIFKKIMKTLTTTLVFGITLFATQLFSQEVDTYKSAISTKKISSFPDSIFMYSYSIDGTRLGIVGKQYYSLKNNILQVKFYAYDQFSSYYLCAQDLYFYNEAGMTDSAIIESSIDSDWDIYAIKKVYTYTDNLLTSEAIFWDTLNDSINDDWQFSKKIIYSYDNKKRIKEETTQYADGTDYRNFIKTSYSLTNNPAGGTIEIDTTFRKGYSISSDSDAWVPNSITCYYYNTKAICVKIKSWQCSDDSDIVSLTTVITEKMYNNTGQLISEDRSTPNTRPVYRTIYEYNSNGEMITETFCENFFEGFYKTYSYEYFYNAEVTNSPEVGKIKFRMYPNPVKERLNIEIQDNSTSDCQLFSANGELIKKLRLEQGINTFNVINLRKGLYFIQIPSKTGIINQKLVKN